MRVSLYDFVGTGLIIKAQTGITWTNQAGGNACLQPECEGVFVPFGNDTTPDGALISAETDLFELSYGPGWPDRVQEALTKYAEVWRPFADITLDQEMISQSVEAWVHVVYRPSLNSPPLFDGAGAPPFRAVLTWTNSD